MFEAEGEGSQEVDAITEPIVHGPWCGALSATRRPASDRFPSRTPAVYAEPGEVHSTMCLPTADARHGLG